MFGFAVDHEVGVDIEQIRPVPDALELAREYFHPDEYEELSVAAFEQQAQAFLSIWTMKEAYLKATGVGLTAPLHEFRVSPRKNGMTITSPAGELMYLIPIPLDEYAAAVAVENPPTMIVCQRFRDVDDCLGMLRDRRGYG